MDIEAQYVIAALQEELARVNENRVYLMALVKQMTDAQLASSLDRAMQQEADRDDPDHDAPE